MMRQCRHETILYTLLPFRNFLPVQNTLLFCWQPHSSGVNNQLMRKGVLCMR